MSVEGKGFHAHSNWFFRREPDGSVRILAPDSLGPGASQRVDLDAGTWASVVASVTAGGETSASFRAAEALHAADVPASAMNFGAALLMLKAGRRVAREGWNGKDMWVELQVPDEHSKMRRPYLYMSPVDGALVPWVASQSDLLADDWTVVA